MRTALLGFGFLLALAGAAQAQTYSSACPIAGRYAVLGSSPGSSGQYQGEMIFTGESAGCFAQWFPPNTSEGRGTVSGDEVSINFTMSGQTGVVRYSRLASGVLDGVWWMDSSPDARGVEKLTPIELAPKPAAAPKPKPAPSPAPKPPEEATHVTKPRNLNTSLGN